MPDVVLLRLNREKVERLQTFAAIHWNDELAAELRAALDSPPVERVECQIRFHDPFKCEDLAILTGTPTGTARSLEAQGYTNLRQQQRTITTFSDGSSLIGPWSDLGEGGDRG